MSEERPKKCARCKERIGTRVFARSTLPGGEGVAWWCDECREEVKTQSLDSSYNAGSTIDPTFTGLYYHIEAKAMCEYAAAHPETTVLYVNAVLVCECGKRHRLRFGPDERT